MNNKKKFGNLHTFTSKNIGSHLAEKSLERNEYEITNQISDFLIPVFERLSRIENILTNSDTPKLMTIRDMTAYTCLSAPTIRREIKRGKLKPFKKDGKKLFRKSDVDNWLNGHS